MVFHLPKQHIGSAYGVPQETQVQDRDIGKWNFSEKQASIVNNFCNTIVVKTGREKSFYMDFMSVGTKQMGLKV